KASLRGIDLVLEQGLNVRVLLLPEGEDPDSFAKSHSSTEFVEFIEKNEEDFITFKTRLLSQEAENDPVKKANLITNIVRSIAVIPETITRTVYIKECSIILDIDEKVLYGEINKIRRKNYEKEYKRTISPDEKFKAASPSVPSFVSDIYSEAQEKEIIRFLLQYAEKTLYTYQEDKYDEPRDVTVVEYIIGELLNDDLKFENLVYKKIFQIYLDGLNNKESFDSKYFINHSDPEISSLAADLHSTPHELSKIFEKGGTLVATEDMKLKDLVPDTIFAYKRKILEIAQGDINEKIKGVGNDKERVEEVSNLQKESMKISNALIAISKDRWVVFK
ncbi:MAG: DNA primase, partial [Bacteroidales bacterium]|nr:DNA primase [Bacteroidales bacterium]